MKKCINLKPHEAAALARGETITIWRAVKPQPEFCGAEGEQGDINQWGWMTDEDPSFLPVSKCNPFPLNVPLLGKETWCEASPEHRDHANIPQAFYKSASTEAGEDIRQEYIRFGHDYRWKSASQMPPWAVRTLVTLSDVRVRKIQDASLGECLRSCVTQGEKRVGLPAFYYPGGDTDHIKALMNLVGAQRSNLWFWSYTATPSKNLS